MPIQCQFLVLKSRTLTLLTDHLESLIYQWCNFQSNEAMLMDAKRYLRGLKPIEILARIGKSRCLKAYFDFLKLVIWFARMPRHLPMMTSTAERYDQTNVFLCLVYMKKIVYSVPSTSQATYQFIFDFTLKGHFYLVSRGPAN